MRKANQPSKYIHTYISLADNLIFIRHFVSRPNFLLKTRFASINHRHQRSTVALFNESNQNLNVNKRFEDRWSVVVEIFD